ncbi:gluconate 5-dehydrogenase [Escherichia sp. E4736]|uniref:gluconate 5-dehydrogenase n=1 Tax=Escherichia sp. E4736 TaxID=2044466 RepID=UPI0010814461|nr:gluconate 5-dehydrogenase [Escherichia sp. E4736]TGB62550.1 gluconate 5-dehydrogenase [Escherichia coli]TLI95999.1 gluconate 5-dehydrogenase [Escherichia sp. E4736]
MEKDIFDLTGKRALITGSAQGIGYLLAKGLGKRGAEIIINDCSAEKAEKTALELCSMGISAHSFPFDVTNFSQIETEIARIEDEIGPVDILINNAGIQRRHPFIEFPESDWDSIINVNQKAVFMLSKYVARYMIQRKSGKIINICSMQSELGRATIIPYAASKGAVKMLTRGMCAELAKYNIQVNGIAPGYFDTEMNKALVNNHEFTQWLCQRTPAGRWGKPDELIGAAVFLATDASNFVNGHMIFVDGGMLAVV